MPAENADVRQKRKELRDHLLEGMSAGVELGAMNYPAWVAQIYREHSPYDRGLLLGVLLEELERGE